MNSTLGQLITSLYDKFQVQYHADIASVATAAVVTELCTPEGAAATDRRDAPDTRRCVRRRSPGVRKVPGPR